MRIHNQIFNFISTGRCFGPEALISTLNLSIKFSSFLYLSCDLIIFSLQFSSYYNFRLCFALLKTASLFVGDLSRCRWLYSHTPYLTIGLVEVGVSMVLNKEWKMFPLQFTNVIEIKLGSAEFVRELSDMAIFG